MPWYPIFDPVCRWSPLPLLATSTGIANFVPRPLDDLGLMSRGDMSVAASGLVASSWSTAPR